MPRMDITPCWYVKTADISQHYSWGHYRYKVASRGILASGDAYAQCFDAIIADLQNKIKCVDDTCVWANFIKAAFYSGLWIVESVCNGITLNWKKLPFVKDVLSLQNSQALHTTQCQVPWCHQTLPHSHWHHRCESLLWAYKPRCICICHVPSHETFPCSFETTNTIRWDRGVGQCLPPVQGDYH